MDGKNFIWRGIFIVIFAGTVLAQHVEKGNDFIHCNYCIGLRSDNRGVVTASLINVMRMYYQFPADNYTTIYNQIDTLCTQGETEQIRFMANMIKDYFDHRRNLDWMMNFSYEEIYLYFKMLSNSELRKTAYEYR